jgi:hypothetical protein
VTVQPGDDYLASALGGAVMSGPGETRPAGEGVSDDEMAREVARQTSSDLKADDVFEREADGAAGETEAAKAGPDDLPT